MRFLKNRYFIIVVSAIIAAVICFVLIPGIVNRRTETIMVVRVKDDVAAYTLIEESMLEVREIGSYNIAADIITDKEEIIGKYTNMVIYPGDNLLPQKFILANELENGFLHDLEQENYMAVTITLKSNAAGVSGMVRTGDIVDVIVYIQDSETGNYSIAEIPELLNLEILDVYRNVQSGSDEIKNITFKVNFGQALKLIEAENDGIVHLISSQRNKKG